MIQLFYFIFVQTLIATIVYKAIIIDDEFFAQEGLKKLIDLAVPNFFSTINVASSLNEGIELIRDIKPDIVFLDINMPNEFGFKIYDYFDVIDFEIIFTTAHANYVMDAVNQWGCLGYLMKPVSISDLKTVLNRFSEKKKNQFISDNHTEVEITEEHPEIINLKNTLNKENGILLFSSVNEINFIKIDEIIYCKAADNYCDIITKYRSYTISKPLKEIEKSINNNAFIRTHRSYLVNLNFAMRLDRKNNILVLRKNCNEDEDIIIPLTASGLKILTNVVS